VKHIKIANDAPPWVGSILLRKSMTALGREQAVAIRFKLV